MSSTPRSDRPRREDPANTAPARFSPSFGSEASVGLLELELEPKLGVKEIAPFDGARVLSIPRNDAWCSPGVQRA
jgi:hypothetical protein